MQLETFVLSGQKRMKAVCRGKKKFYGVGEMEGMMTVLKSF